MAFRTEGDTEVLYELLLQPDASRLLDQVDGMFAFVLVLPDGELLRAGPAGRQTAVRRVGRRGPPGGAHQ